MKKTLAIVMVLLWILASFAGCGGSDDSTVASGDAAGSEQAAEDQGSGDQAAEDQGSGDQAAEDQGSGDQAAADGVPGTVFNEITDAEARSMEFYPYDSVPIMDGAVIERSTAFDDEGGEIVFWTETPVEEVVAYYTDILDDYNDFIAMEDGTGLLMHMANDGTYNFLVNILPVQETGGAKVTLNCKRQ